MARSSIAKGPNYIHPEKPSAVGSRNSANRDNRNEYSEASVIIGEQVDKIINHISSKLPPEALEKLHIGGTIKEMLHNYFNQGFQNMFNRYLVTVEDEMAKKFRHLVNRQESRNVNRYTPKEIPALLDAIGGVERFNSGKIENSIVNIFGHLQGHMHKGMFDIEHITNKLLREKADIGAFISDQNSYSIVKCYLKNNALKPEGVMDIRLVINIVESEILKPIYHYRAATQVIVKDIISTHILKLVDREIDDINSQLAVENQKKLSENDALLERLKKLENHIEFEEKGADSAQYDFVAHRFTDAIKGLGPEINHLECDPLGLKENIYRIVEEDNTRNDGFNKAVNILTGILDNAHLGYQHIQNFKNARRLVIREYAETNPKHLPDEQYSASLTYYNNQQLRELRTAYCQQLEEFEAEAEKIWQVYNRIFQEQKTVQGIVSFDDIAKNVLRENRAKAGTRRFQKETLSEEGKKEQWDEISFIIPEKSDREKINETFQAKRQKIKNKFAIIRERLKELYEWENPKERIIMEQRLDFLENAFEEFNSDFNPFQLQAGLVVDISMSTIKRKEVTINGMSLVLDDFLSHIASGFSDKTMISHQKQKASESQANIRQAFSAGSQ